MARGVRLARMAQFRGPRYEYSYQRTKMQVCWEVPHLPRKGLTKSNCGSKVTIRGVNRQCMRSALKANQSPGITILLSGPTKKMPFNGFTRHQHPKTLQLFLSQEVLACWCPLRAARSLPGIVDATSGFSMGVAEHREAESADKISCEEYVPCAICACPGHGTGWWLVFLLFTFYNSAPLQQLLRLLLLLLEGRRGAAKHQGASQ
jgi:hypothetical protein